MRLRSANSRQAVIVITGATRGLGRAMVDEFVRLGHQVVGCARTKAHIKALVKAHPAQDFQVVDIAHDLEVKLWAKRVLQRHGPPDFVLNNAAVFNQKGVLWKVRDCDFSEMVDVNIRGLVNVIRHFAPPMALQGHGVIVNFTSRWGRKWEQKMAGYCATKWAVVALTRALASELKPARVAAVDFNPGIVRTGMLRKYAIGLPPFEMSLYPNASEWAEVAVPYILGLGMQDSGKLREILFPQFHRIELNSKVVRGS